MFRRCTTFIFVATVTFAFIETARASPIQIWPVIASPMPATVFTTPNLTGASAASALMPTPVDHSFLGQVAHFLDDLGPPPPSGQPRAAAARNPSLRDSARERDATSFGIRSAPMSTAGMAIAGAGAGAAAAQLVDLGKITNKLPIKLAPSMCQGGGGITIKTPW